MLASSKMQQVRNDRSQVKALARLPEPKSELCRPSRGSCLQQVSKASQSCAATGALLLVRKKLAIQTTSSSPLLQLGGVQTNVFTSRRGSKWKPNHFQWDEKKNRPPNALYPWLSMNSHCCSQVSNGGDNFVELMELDRSALHLEEDNW